MAADTASAPADWPFRTRDLPLADGVLRYVDEGLGPTLILVHGTPTWGYEWRHVIPALARTHRVLVPDHLGFGRSDRPRGEDYSPEAHAKRFASFVEQVAGDAPLSLVLHDFGGPIALDWVLDHAARVSRLVIVNSWMWSFADDRVMRRRAALASSAIGRLLYRHANASLRLIMPSAYGNRALLTPAIHAQYLDRFPDATSRELVLFALARSLLGSSAYFDSLWRRRDALTRVPLSLIWGMRDSAFGPALLDRWMATFPHASVTRIEDAGHWPHEEAPDAVNAALAQALPPVASA